MQADTANNIIAGVGVVINGGLLTLVAVMQASLRDIKQRVVRLENAFLGAPPPKGNSKHAGARVHRQPPPQG